MYMNFANVTDVIPSPFPSSPTGVMSPAERGEVALFFAELYPTGDRLVTPQDSVGPNATTPNMTDMTTQRNGILEQVGEAMPGHPEMEIFEVALPYLTKYDIWCQTHYGINAGGYVPPPPPPTPEPVATTLDPNAPFFGRGAGSTEK